MHDLIRLNFELFPDFMVVIVTCKNEEDSIKTEGARVFTTLNIDFSDAQGQLTPYGGILPKSKLIQAFMHIFVTCKNEEDSIKNKKLTASKAFSIPPAMWSRWNID